MNFQTRKIPRIVEERMKFAAWHRHQNLFIRVGRDIHISYRDTLVQNEIIFFENVFYTYSSLFELELNLVV